jgi:4a-hydroxytetrahydrobiopterin dehydratase
MAEEKPHVYSEPEVAAKLTELGLTAWYREDGWLRRKFTTDGWPTTLMVVNAVGFLCEAAWHHADLAVTWGKHWVQMQTS